MKTIDFSYFIERYLADEMSEAEKLWFQKELEGNEKLRNEVDLRKRTDNILKEKEIISLRSKLSEIEKQRAAIAVTNKPERKAYARYAAVISVAVLIGFFIFMPGKKLTKDEIMSRYYKTYEPVTTQRSVTVNISSDFEQALEFYQTHDFANAAKYFSKVISEKPKDMYSMLLYGISNFEERKFPEAESSFGRVISNNNNLYIDQAEWYLALCYINTNEKDRALGLLEKIREENGIYKNEAREIIKKLK
jgi:TolA-binding protein